jgi:hypothetical protein
MPAAFHVTLPAVRWAPGCVISGRGHHKVPPHAGRPRAQPGQRIAPGCQKIFGRLATIVSAIRRRAAIASMSFTVKAHHETYYAVFTRKTMEDALAKASELVDAGYNAVTIQDENGYLYLQSDFVLLAQKPTTEQ